MIYITEPEALINRVKKFLDSIIPDLTVLSLINKLIWDVPGDAGDPPVLLWRCQCHKQPVMVSTLKKEIRRFWNLNGKPEKLNFG